MFALCRPRYHGSTPRGTPQNFDPNWPTPYWFDRRRHSMETVVEWSNSKIAQRSQWRAYRKPTPLFRIVGSMTLWPPKKWGPKCPLLICRISNGHFFATGLPIHFMFCSTVGFLWSADRMALSVSIKSKMVGRHDMTWHDKTKKISATTDRCRLLPNYFGRCKLSLA